MKKISLFFTLIMLIAAFCGCSAPAGESGPSAVQETASYQHFKLNIRYIDESEHDFYADTAEYILPDGQHINCVLADGTVSENSFPAATGISCKLRSGGDVVAEHGISFWTGYASDYYNNLNMISVDMPGNTESIFLTVKVQEDGRVRCMGISEISFAEEEKASDFTGAIDEATAIASGLYGTRAVSENGVRLRSGPSTSSEELRKMNFADVVMLMNEGEESDGITWFKVKYEDYEGYISGEYLGKLYTVNKNGVNIREQPSAKSASLNLLSSGARVVEIGDRAERDGEIWLRVITRGGTKGYIRGDFLS